MRCFASQSYSWLAWEPKIRTGSASTSSGFSNGRSLSVKAEAHNRTDHPRKRTPPVAEINTPPKRELLLDPLARQASQTKKRQVQPDHELFGCIGTATLENQPSATCCGSQSLNSDPSSVMILFAAEPHEENHLKRKWIGRTWNPEVLTAPTRPMRVHVAACVIG